MKIIGILLAAWFSAIGCAFASHVLTRGNTVTIYPDKGEARVVQLQVLDDRIVRVRATSKDQLPLKPQSLIIVPQLVKPQFTLSEDSNAVYVKAARLQAVVNKGTGTVNFFDVNGKRLTGETDGGKRFWDYQVPSREIGVDSARVQERQHQGIQWQLTFDYRGHLYGLGQHQSEELDMAGRNEDLFQYNTKVSVPFVVSSSNFGLLWDSYSYCRFGWAGDYMQLNKAFRLYDRQGHEGHLTGTYTARNGRTLVREEDSLYFEYDLPASQQAYDSGGIKNLPKGFDLNGSTVVYEGFLQNTDSTTITSSLRDFILYYAGYVKVYIGGQLVVPERWRTAWNPNTYRFSAKLPKGKKTQLRIEWRPDGNVSYCGLRVARPVRQTDQRQLCVWSEMSQDMDYYFIAGSSMDDVIAGYRQLTGKAPVYPKWVLGFWQSRERYKTQDELLATLGEFRRRHIPVDNIVQDWNYWPEDQWGSHEFEALRFPNPQRMIDSVHQMHGRFMLSVWPKFYVNTEHYQQFDRKGWMYHQAVTDDIHDWVGPGYVGSFYDAYSDGARKLFLKQMTQKLPKGIDSWWMDASEPNVRDCTPLWYRKALCGPTALGTSTEYFNAYALVNAQAIYEGLRRNNTSRVFLLTRSGFAGLQRYSTATWSGDIGTRWEDMRAQMTAGMNYSLSGLPFWGMDIGGFCVENRYVRAQQLFDKTGQENEDLREWRELQCRWNQFGCFVPLYRVHGQWPFREVWNIAPDDHPAYQSIVWYHRLRYRLMPYLYSMAGWVYLNDYTMMRALVMDFGSDANVFDIKDQWMFGPSLMACPVSHYKSRNRSVYFPRLCGWYDFYSGRFFEGGQQLVVDAPYERIPVFVPEGSIVPFGPAMEWSDEKSAELTQLYIYAGRDASFTLYEDEGTNYNYEKGLYSTIELKYDEARKMLTIGERRGRFDGMLKKRRFNIVYMTKETEKELNLDHPEGRIVEYDGGRMEVWL